MKQKLSVQGLGILFLLLSTLLSACGSTSTGGNNSSLTVMHLGYFPNLTHAVAIVGVTTNVIVRKQFLDEHPDVVNKFLQAHVAVVQYIASNPDKAKSIVNSEIKRITGKALVSKEIDQAFTNLDITYDPLASSLLQSADRAYSLGFLGKSKPDLNGIYDLGPLNQVLSSKGFAIVEGP